MTPREDLWEGRPLDAAEFAVHLDQVRDSRAHEDYQNPARFFERTFLTASLRQTSSEVLRRLAGGAVAERLTQAAFDRFKLPKILSE